jgi:hypothetical protein
MQRKRQARSPCRDGRAGRQRCFRRAQSQFELGGMRFGERAGGPNGLTTGLV